METENGSTPTSEPVSSDGSSQSTKTFTIKKINVVLDEYNFLVWKQQVLLAVPSLRLEKLLTGALKPPPATVTTDGVTTDNEDYEVFFAQDSALAVGVSLKTTSWLLSTISSSLLLQFVGTNTASKIWSTVLRFFASTSTTTVMSLHYKLRSIKKGDLSMRAYVAKVKEICNALASCRSPISDLETIATILNGLSIEYQPFVAVITASREPFTLDAAISVLFDAEMQLNSYNSLSDVSPALNVVQVSTGKSNEGNASRPYRQFSGGRGKSGRMRLQCQLCGKLGHLVDRCWHRFDENFVPVTARSKEPAKAESNANVCSLDVETTSCACRGGSSAVAEPNTEHQVNMVTASPGPWFVESGASHHVSSNQANVLHGMDYEGPSMLTVGNGVKVPIYHIGQSSLLAASRSLKLNQVFHVPNITKNLVSVSKLARDNDVFLEFHANTCMVRDERTGVVLLKGSEVDGLYRFDNCLPVASMCNKRADAYVNLAYSTSPPAHDQESEEFVGRNEDHGHNEVLESVAVAPAHDQESEEFEGHDEGHGYNEVLETVDANSSMHGVHGSTSTPGICVESIPMNLQEQSAQPADTLDSISHGDMSSDNNIPIPIPDEKSCPYFMRTGSCKFGVACKFHHPHPASPGAGLSVNGLEGSSPTGVPYASGFST
ncbi:hypothetical protein GQ457_11G003440 [Hibiscus cannabinus]